MPHFFILTKKNGMKLIPQFIINILKEKSDPVLEKIIECFEDGSDFIFNDEDFLKKNISQ